MDQENQQLDNNQVENQHDLENAASVPEPTPETSPMDTVVSDEVSADIIALPEDAPRTRDRNRDRQKRRPQRPKREFTRYITVMWSGQREPVDDMYVCDIEKSGEWLTVTTLELFRSRREVLDYLREVESGLVVLDFPFSFPQPFIDFVRPETKATDWRGLIHTVREEIKKNLDDGVRLWIERIGRYRESQLVSEEEEFQRRGSRPQPDRRRGNRGLEPLAAYERRSVAERFRRTEHNIRRPAEGHLTSALQIGYNRLTSRYEFGDARQRGRAALLGMSMLDQLLETSDKAAVWPFSNPSALTIAEVQPWVFTRGKTIDPAECRKMLTAEEDNALAIEPRQKDLACRNPIAQAALMTTLGIIKAEGRVERAIRPLRDYPKEFYADPKVQAEGWYYGVGYRPEGAPRKGDEKKGDKNADRKEKGKRPMNEPQVQGAVDESLPADLDRVAVIPQPPAEVQAPEVVEQTSNDPDLGTQAAA